MDNENFQVEPTAQFELSDADWERKVREYHADRCANCGSIDTVINVKMIVPSALGGKKVVSNGTLICRTCEFNALHSAPTGDCAVNLYISKELYGRVQDRVAEGTHNSVSSLARSLVELYVNTPDNYEDVMLYQDEKSEIRINLWLNRKIYEKLQEVAACHTITIAAAIRGLFIMYCNSRSAS